MRRKIDNIWCQCIDAGCNDFERAARNRKMIANKENILGYLWIEAIVRAWPRNKLLPGWLSTGEFPTVNKHERNSLNQYGIYAIGDNGLIRVDNPRGKYYNRDIDE